MKKQLPIEIINDILEMADTGIKLFYSDKTQRYETKINSLSIKFYDICDLFQNRITLYHKKEDYSIFNQLIKYDISEMFIIPKNKNKVVYYKTILYCTLLREISNASTR
jgi:hypothetical protein